MPLSRSNMCLWSICPVHSSSFGWNQFRANFMYCVFHPDQMVVQRIWLSLSTGATCLNGFSTVVLERTISFSVKHRPKHTKRSHRRKGWESWKKKVWMKRRISTHKQVLLISLLVAFHLGCSDLSILSSLYDQLELAMSDLIWEVSVEGKVWVVVFWYESNGSRKSQMEVESSMSKSTDRLVADVCLRCPLHNGSKAGQGKHFGTIVSPLIRWAIRYPACQAVYSLKARAGLAGTEVFLLPGLGLEHFFLFWRARGDINKFNS